MQADKSRISGSTATSAAQRCQKVKIPSSNCVALCIVSADKLLGGFEQVRYNWAYKHTFEVMEQDVRVSLVVYQTQHCVYERLRRRSYDTWFFSELLSVKVNSVTYCT